MDDFGFLTQYVDPRVAAAAVAVTEWLKAQLPESWTKGKRVRWLALLVVAGCYVAVWLAEFSAEVREIGTRVVVIAATYILAKVGYEAVKPMGMPEEKTADVTVEAGQQATVHVDAPQATESPAPPPQDTQHGQPVQTLHGVSDVSRRSNQ